jgi:hypothetical protein
MTNKLEPKYRARLKQLEHLHPPAFRFLSRFEDEDLAHGLRLSTSTHAHVYKGSTYLMRIELTGAREPTNIVLSPNPHIRIEEGANDRADLLFPKVLTELVMKHGGFKAGWAPRGKGPELELRPSTPDAFFDALFGWLRDLQLPTVRD